MQQINYAKYVGECIKWARVQSGLSRRAFSNRLGINHQKLKKLERGHIDIHPSRLTHIFYNGIMKTGRADFRG